MQEITALRRTRGRDRDEWFALLDARGVLRAVSTERSPTGSWANTTSADGGPRSSSSSTSRSAGCALPVCGLTAHSR